MTTPKAFTLTVNTSAPPAVTPPTRGPSRVVAILTIALGCTVVLGAIVSATFSTVAAANVLPAKDAVQEQIRKWTGKALPDNVINRSWGNLRFTWDPLAASVKTSADDAVAAGLLRLPPNGIKGLYDLRLLNSTLAASKQRLVSANSLGQQ